MPFSCCCSSMQVYGDKDADGFYRGESGGRHGYVPCNMVSEIQVDDEETRDQLLQQGFLSTETSIEKMGMFSYQYYVLILRSVFSFFFFEWISIFAVWELLWFSSNTGWQICFLMLLFVHCDGQQNILEIYHLIQQKISDLCRSLLILVFFFPSVHIDFQSEFLKKMCVFLNIIIKCLQGHSFE